MNRSDVDLDMDTKEQQKLLLKILIGAAWVDRNLEPQEIDYLQQLLQQYNLHSDSELQQLLEQPVPIAQTEFWIIDYLEESTNTERMQLLSAIASLLMADENVSEIEHDLLDEYYDLMARIPPHPEATPNLVQTLGGFVKRLMGSLVN